MRKSLWIGAAVVSQILTGIEAEAKPADMITNGSFEVNDGVGQIGTKTTASGWSTQVLSDPPGQGFAFIMNNTADSSGTPSVLSPPNITIWGPNTGSNNGFTVSPDGGAFLAISDWYSRARVSQSVSGLQIGSQYQLSFYWAIAQATDTTGAFQAGWNLTFGSNSDSSGLQSVPSRGFLPWTLYTSTFTATSTTQSLDFDATGTNEMLGFVLFDGVSLTPVPVPEPSTYAMGAVATVILGWISRKRRKFTTTNQAA